MSQKENLKFLKELSEDKNFDLKKRRKFKKLLNDKNEFLKFHIRMMGGNDKEDVDKAFKKKVESDKNSIIKNPQLTKQKKESLLKNYKEYEQKSKRELKEMIEWSKK